MINQGVRTKTLRAAGDPMLFYLICRDCVLSRHTTSILQGVFGSRTGQRGSICLLLVQRPFVLYINLGLGVQSGPLKYSFQSTRQHIATILEARSE